LLEVQCEVSTVSDDWGAAVVGPLCFIKSKVNAAVYQDILDHKLYGDADFIVQQDNGLMTMVFLCLIGQQTHLT